MLAVVLSIQIVNSDCVEVLKSFEDNYFDLAICYYPYGIGMSSWKNESNGDGSEKQRDLQKVVKTLDTKKDWDSGIPQKEYWEQLFRVSEKSSCRGVAITLQKSIHLKWVGFIGIKKAMMLQILAMAN